VGVHYDSWRGEIEFYLNRTPLGKAFTGIPSATDIYPMFCSTSAKTKMRLVCAQKYPAGLAFDCARALCRKKLCMKTTYTEAYLEYTVPYLLYAKNNKYQYNLLMNKRQVAEWTKTLPPLLWRFINDHCWFLIGCKLDNLKDEEVDDDLIPSHLASMGFHPAGDISMVSASSCSDDEFGPASRASTSKHKISQRQKNSQSVPAAAANWATSDEEDQDEEGFGPVGADLQPRTTGERSASPEELTQENKRVLLFTKAATSSSPKPKSKRLRLRGHTQKKVSDKVRAEGWIQTTQEDSTSSEN